MGAPAGSRFCFGGPASPVGIVTPFSALGPTDSSCPYVNSLQTSLEGGQGACSSLKRSWKLSSGCPRGRSSVQACSALQFGGAGPARPSWRAEGAAKHSVLLLLCLSLFL